MNFIDENLLTLISEKTELEGTFRFNGTTRIHGKLKGEVYGLPGSTLILTESAVVEGTLSGDELVIEGFVKGQIRAASKVTLAANARVLGDVHCPSITIAPGCRFEGSCKMDAHGGAKASPGLDTSESLAPSLT
jgi:cytoskeletal protein CcmA (bactofilin family)